MASQGPRELIEQAVANIHREVPALERLKLVVGLELRGRGDVQLYRVELPGPKIAKDSAADAPVRLSVSRGQFNVLARKGTVRDWRDAFDAGIATASGPPELLKLVENVVARQEQRTRTPKTRRL